MAPALVAPLFLLATAVSAGPPPAGPVAVQNRLGRPVRVQRSGRLPGGRHGAGQPRAAGRGGRRRRPDRSPPGSNPVERSRASFGSREKTARRSCARWRVPRATRSPTLCLSRPPSLWARRAGAPPPRPPGAPRTLRPWRPSLFHCRRRRPGRPSPQAGTSASTALPPGSHVQRIRPHTGGGVLSPAASRIWITFLRMGGMGHRRVHDGFSTIASRCRDPASGFQCRALPPPPRAGIPCPDRCLQARSPERGAPPAMVAGPAGWPVC